MFINDLINKKLAGNIAALFTLKGAEYIIAFITLPYLLRILGPDKFGAITFAQGIVNYGNLVVDYGFNLTAPRDIAKANIKDIPIQFAAILCAKFLLLTLVICIGGIILFFLKDWFDIFLIICIFPNLIGNTLFPIWYFQGIQQMKFITYFNLFARSISVIGIFALVKQSSDYWLAALLQSITPLLAGVVALGMLFFLHRELFHFPNRQDIVSKLKDGWEIFISTIFINLYTNSNIVILRFLTNDTCVGYFSAANKLIEAIKGLLAPVSNAIFPHVSVLAKESREEAVDFLRKTVKIIGSISFVVSLFVFLFANVIVHIIMGTSYSDSITVLRILGFLPFIIGLSNVFGVQTMVAFGMQTLFSRIVMASAILNFVLVFPFVYLLQEIGLAVTIVIVECFVTVTMYYALVKNNIILK